MQTMIVTAESGKTVNLRTGPGERYNIVAQVPVGDTVNMQTDRDGWAFVTWGTKAGYMMDKFLTPADDAKQPDGGNANGNAGEIACAEIKKRLAEIERLAGEALAMMEVSE